MLTRRTLLRTLGAGTALIGTGALVAPASAYTPRTRGEKIEPTTWQQQVTQYYCGPAAARIAVSARDSTPPSQGTLASALGTTTNGTNFGSMAPVLSRFVPNAVYRAEWMGSMTATTAQGNLLWDRATKNVDDGYATVCNWIVLPGQYPKWGGNRGTIYHYVTIDGYDTRYRTLRISDPAGSTLSSSLPHRYWLPAQSVANYCAGRGYFW